MISVLELKKLEAEKARVYSARLDLELRLEEMKESISRIEESIQVQKNREIELDQKIKEVSKEK